MKESRIDREAYEKGILFDIQRWSLNDGEGIRTLVFFKGCPLRCHWCCNPESQAFEPEIALFPEKCTNCGTCREVCPAGVALSVSEGGFVDRALCRGCGKCADFCAAGARKRMGKEYTVGEVLEAVKKDMVFYRRSGGGVTFSGGEPMAQPVFLFRLASRCKELGMDLALETCGYFDWEKVQKIIKMMDQIFIDLKHMDPGAHKRYTGVDNELIMDNAKKISASKIPMVVRVPVIPGINDTKENIRETADFVRTNLPSCLGIELLPYHSLGEDKYRALGRSYRLKNLKAPPEEKIHSLKGIISEAKVSVVNY